MTKYTKRDKNFVAPAHQARAPIVEVERNLPTAPITPPMPHSSHIDRARGFTVATGPLAAATGFVVLLIGITAFGVPVLSVAALLLALAGFTATWAAAFIVHTFVSPDGALFAHTLLTWNYLKREQKERHRRYASLCDKNGGTHE